MIPITSRGRARRLVRVRGRRSFVSVCVQIVAVGPVAEVGERGSIVD